MGRTETIKFLANLTDIVADENLDVTILISPIESFRENLFTHLTNITIEGEQANKLQERLKGN